MIREDENNQHDDQPKLVVNAPSTPARLALLFMVVVLAVVLFAAERHFRRRQTIGTDASAVNFPAMNLEAWIPPKPWGDTLNLMESEFLGRTADPREADNFVRYAGEAHLESYWYERIREHAKDHPNNLLIQYLWGKFQLHVREFDGALATFQRVTELSPSFALVYKDIVYAHLQAGQTEQAIDQGLVGLGLAKETSDNLTRADILGNLSMAYLVADDLIRAEHYQEVALELHDEFERTVSLAIDYSNLARIYAANGDHQRAVETFARGEQYALETDSPSVIVRYYASWLMFHQRRGEQHVVQQLVERMLPYLNKEQIQEMLIGQ